LFAFGAFAPTISKILATTHRTIWIEICSPAGATRVAMDLTTDQSHDSHLTSDSHCGYCLLQQHFPALPSAEVALSPAAISTNRLSSGNGGTTIVKRIARSAHRTRAPPAIS